MAGAARKSPLVIGVGNPLRGDDGLGAFVAQELRKKLAGAATVIEHSGEGAGLMEAWRDHDFVIVVDAVSSGAEAGKIFRLAADEEPIPARFFNYSTHAFSLAEAVELARTLNKLPKRLIIYGVEGRAFGNGEAISESVRQSARVVIKAVLSEVL